MTTRALVLSVLLSWGLFGATTSASAGEGRVFQHGVQVGPWLPVLIHQDRSDADWMASGGLGGKLRWGWMLRKKAGAEGSVHTQARYLFAGPWQGWHFTGGVWAGPRFGTPGSNLFGLSLLSGLDVRGDDIAREGLSVGEAWSLGLPLVAKLRLSVVYLLGGVQPWWYVTDTARPAIDWARAPVAGFGDEMDIVAGIGFDVWILSIQLDGTPRFTSYGTAVDLGLTVAFGFGPK